MPWNFIFDGADLTLVDGYQWEGNDEQNLQDTIKKVEEML